jgi:sulfur carrier protein
MYLFLPYRENHEIELKRPRSIKKLLRDLEINPETVIVIVNGTLATPDRTVEDSDKVEVRPVVSGG